MTYHLSYYSTDLKVHTIVALTEQAVYHGFIKVRKEVEPRAIPLFMIIKSEDGKSYYIPQYVLFEELNLSDTTDKTDFLFLCAENGYFDTEMIYHLVKNSVVCWDLNAQQKNILDTLGMHYFLVDGRTQANYYQIEY